MAATDFANLPGRGIKPLASFRAHTRAALLVFLITLLLGIPVVFIKGEVFYSTTAVLQVAPRYMKTLRDDGELDFPSNTQYREFLEQQTRSVNRYDIVRDALLSLGDKAKDWRRPGHSERRSVDLLREALMVRSIPDTYMIEIRLQSKEKEGLAEVVNAVVNTYVERMRTERVFGADVRVRMLEAREAEIVKIIEDKTEKRTAIALQLGIGAFSGKEENPYDRVLADLRSSHAEARNKRFEAESQLKAFETNGETDIKTRSLQEAVLIDPGLSNLKANLFKRRADLLTQLSGLQPAHPAYPEVNAELKRIDSELGSQASSLKEQVKQSVLARYRSSLDQSRAVEANLNGDLQELTRKGSAFAGFYNQAMTLTYDIDQQRKELDAVRERLNLFAAEQNSFGFVRLLTPALPPEIPFGMGKKKILLLVIAAAFMLMVVVPVGIDLLDRRIQTVNDAEKVLGIPSLGWMVERSNQATQLFGDDLLRRMAGSLINEQQRQGTRVFGFTSVKPAGGASELVLSLAKTLDALGYRALAVEANAFRRDARYAGERPGLADCLRGESDPASCIGAATDSLPARVQVGDTGRGNHLDRLDRIKEVTSGWAGEFNFVLVDLPPLLLSADTEIVARDLAHLLVIIEANGINAGELRRAGRQLEKLDPSAVGIVVNRVRPFDGGGYLQGSMLEYLSGRKLNDYFTTSHWLLGLQARLIGLQMGYPRLGALAEAVFSMVCRVAAAFGRSLSPQAGGPAQLESKTRTGTAAATVRPAARLALPLLALVAALSTAGYFLVKHPGSWTEMVSEILVDPEPLAEPLAETPATRRSRLNAAVDLRDAGKSPGQALGKRFELKIDDALPAARPKQP